MSKHKYISLSILRKSDNIRVAEINLESLYPKYKGNYNTKPIPMFCQI